MTIQLAMVFAYALLKSISYLQTRLNVIIIKVRMCKYESQSINK